MIPTKFELDSLGERGQVGIGTLIIFIAMVLVAAVAAGVLINTSGYLESQASDTGNDARSQVSNRVRFVAATGNVSEGGDGVNELSLTVMKGAGASAIAVQDATIQFVSEGAVETLNVSNGNVSTTLVQAGDTSAPLVLDDKEDRLKITLDLYENDTDEEILSQPLSEGSEATVKFVDQSGATSIYGVNVPDTITSDQQFVQV